MPWDAVSLPREGSEDPQGTTEGRNRRGSGAASLAPNYGVEKKKLDRPGPQPSRVAGAPIPRGQPRWGGSQLSLLLPPFEGSVSLCL